MRDMNSELDLNEIRRIEAEENLVIDVQYLIQEILDEKGMTRSDLAKATGLSKARLSQLFRSEANPTLRNVARILASIDERVEFCRVQKGASAASKSEWTEELDLTPPPPQMPIRRAGTQQVSLCRITNDIWPMAVEAHNDRIEPLLEGMVA